MRDKNIAVLTVGLGAVSTTAMAGVELVRRGRALPIGSLTQLGTARLGPRKQQRSVPLRELLPLTSLSDIVFGAWDVVDEDGATVAARSRVLSLEDLSTAHEFLTEIRPKPGCHNPDRVRRIRANHTMSETHLRDQIDRLRRDIQDFKSELGASRAVVIHTGSTETYLQPPRAALSLSDLERALDRDDPTIGPAILYAYAALKEGAPFANGTPNHCVDLPALWELSRETNTPIAGKDLKSGQTMLKTVLAPAIKARLLGLRGWFSTNILGNRDGEVLDDPDAFHAKELTKSGVLDHILQPDVYPELYRDYSHKVAIHYYPPRGDEKEGWDNIDITGWLGYPMQIKVNFLCRDSILAAPLVLDLALFLDLAKRKSWRGIQEWLSFYFKCPMARPGVQPEQDLFIQLTKLKNTLRVLAGEDTITHLGLEYYGDDLPLQRSRA